MNWYVIASSTSDEYLEHGWLKDTARKVHKYILRVKDGAKWRYFYAKAEIDAWIQKKKKSNESPANLHSRQKKVGRGRVTARKRKEINLREFKDRDKKMRDIADAVSDEEWQKYVHSHKYEYLN